MDGTQQITPEAMNEDLRYAGKASYACRAAGLSEADLTPAKMAELVAAGRLVEALNDGMIYPDFDGGVWCVDSSTVATSWGEAKVNFLEADHAE